MEFNLVLALVVLLGNAFFVGAEFALVSARRSNIELKALAGTRAAKVTLQAMERVSLMLAGAQLGITLCSLIFGAVGEPIVAHALEAPFQSLGLSADILHPLSFVIALSLMTYIHVLLGEMVPKNLSLAASTEVALVLVPPLYYLVQLLRPVIATMNTIANGIIRLFGIKPRSEVKSSFSHDEVAGFIKESHREGLLSTEEERLLSGALDLEERTIEQIILPLNRAVTTTPTPTVQEIETLCAQTGFSRFPVPDMTGKLQGYVHVKDLLDLPDNTAASSSLPKRTVRPLITVRVQTSLRDALAQLQRTRSHIAEVIDSRGVTTGIIMLEDVLEELVGTIRDDTRKTV